MTNKEYVMNHEQKQEQTEQKEGEYMRYKVYYSNELLSNWNVHEFDDLQDTIDYCIENLGDEPFDNMLDECYTDIEICDLHYSPSIALQRVDPVAYNCGKNDYYDSLSCDLKYELERMNKGDKFEFYDYTIELV